VDSAQGSEADLVIVSLVRNNHRTGTSALGFLRDPRRMNVLLSRAKKQLVLVGSLEFLHEATRHVKESADDELAFIRVFLKTIASMRKENALSGAPKVAVIKSASIGNVT